MAVEVRVTDSITSDIAAVSRVDVIPKILEVVCRTTGMGFAAVARVTRDRWVACAVQDNIGFGLTPGAELELKSTICDEIRDSGKLVVFDDASVDPVFRDHHTPRIYGLKSYISVPIRHRGEFFGTLCAIDPNPAAVNNPETIGMFELFADLIGRHLDLENELAASAEALLDAKQAEELRDQFIAVLGHDLRNPLAAVDGGLRLIAKTPLNERATTLVGMMHSSVGRMAGLIDNVLDFARGRLGGGFNIDRQLDPDLDTAFYHVVTELQTAYPDRRIETAIDIDQPIEGDTRRLTQLLSNLLANALTHGAMDAPVRVVAETKEGQFELSVSNQGPPIPDSAMRSLFQPFVRAAIGPNQQGLGLGLYISSEIARVHGGALEVESTPDETRFTFRMPLA
jgi:signal transduction histidine kinase